ncbi:ComF family protein [Mycolicibacterium madagascariense]|uniref:ComF family protein n=1 Tax=Mycolicibacterium madagascariense TaxID=212765 RepID=UPI0013D56CD6|nr:ComF family protein [Mycolicibacterium madagascariense]MCV7014417.1 ComF family protein [Mycolicibacterium madagascariense]
MLDLVLPRECGGCGAPATRWCPTCACALAVSSDHPVVITPRLDPGVPVLSLGRYAGPRRAAILAMKEHGRTDLIGPLSVAVGAAVTRLLDWGIVEAPLTVVPAPTKWTSARRRGGDPVTAIARAAAGAHVGVDPALRLRAFTRDSVGLTPDQRVRNVAGRVLLRHAVPGEVLLLDDVVTTGATGSEAVRVLQTAGSRVAAMLAIAHA